MIFIIVFITLVGVGVSTGKGNKTAIAPDAVETRIIKQTRQTVYDTSVVQDWQ